jgi:DNA-binding NtrC family response regulator
LFGIEKKIATGVDRKRGEIRSAHGGDLFFDEIGDMREDTQAGILRVLEDRKVKPVGTEQYVDVDVRFISATEKDIEAKAAIGSFRGALLQRLRQGGTVFLPPLRERMEDVPILVKKFVEEAQDANPSAMKRTIEPETLDKIRSFDWPGNIRQLHDCIFEAVNNYLDVEHLFPIHIKFPESGSRTISYPASPLSPTESTPSYVPTSSRTLNELIAEIDEFDFSQHPTDDLVGKLPALERAYARLSARYLEAALKANTKNRSAEKPEGDFSIKQAVETMTGSKVEGYVPRRMIEQVLKNEANRPILEKEDSILAAVARTLSDRKTKRDKTN